MSEGSNITHKSASMSRGECGEALRGALEEFTQPDPEIGVEGSHILSHGVVNLGRTQIKFRARDKPSEWKEYVISLRLYERRRDQRFGKPESPI